MMRTTGGHYPQSLDNGVLPRPAERATAESVFGPISCSAEERITRSEGHRVKEKLAKNIADGENPAGLMVQTPNGTSRQDLKQLDRAYNVNVDRWTNNTPFDGDLSGL